MKNLSKNSRKILGYVLYSISGIFCAMALLWSAGAIYFDLNWPSWVRGLLSIGWILLSVSAIVFVRPRRRGILAALTGFLIIVAWYISIPPRQDLDWQTVHSRTAYADIDGDNVTIHNIRDFDFRAPDDFTAIYETRSFNMKNLRGVDLFLNYWGSDLMAHPILSFDFGEDGHVTFSIETRREKGEGFSMLGGLFKMFEIIYVVGTERDSAMLRVVSPGEEVFLYRSTMNADDTRTLFMQYLRRINELHERPEFYNAITANCTTSIRRQSSPERRRPWDWRMLINGEFDRMLYENGILDTGIPFEELKRRAQITEKAEKARDDLNFSAKIREGM